MSSSCGYAGNLIDEMTIECVLENDIIEFYSVL